MRKFTQLLFINILPVLFIALGLFGVNEKAWGQTYKNGAWWSLYDTSDYSRSTAAGGEIHNYTGIFAPNTGNVTIDTYMTVYQIGSTKGAKPTGYSIKFGNATISISENEAHNVVHESSSGKIIKSYSYSYSWITDKSASGLGTTIASVKADYQYNIDNTLRNVHIKNVRIPAAKHILLNDGSTNGNTSLTKNFSDTKVEATSAAQTINFRSFLTDTKGITITLTSGDAEVFRLGTSSNTTGSISSSKDGKSYNVGANACASGNGTSYATASGSTLGDISQYGFNVYFYPKAATNYTGTITITDGTSTATVTVNGTGVLNENAITWNPNTLDKKNWGNQVDANATATNNESGCPAITYSIENGKESYVTIADGKITFNKAGAGQTVKITASQEANYKYVGASLTKEFTIKSAQTLAYNAGSVDVSVSADDKNTLNLEDLQTSHVGNGGISYSKKSGEGVVLNGSTFYATTAGSCQILASAASTADYDTCSTVINITVSKRTPTVVFAKPEHIYSGNTLENMATVQYNGEDVPTSQVDFSYSFDNPSWFSLNPSNSKQVLVSTQYDNVQTAKLYVTTAETNYYASVTADTTYTLEVKRTPEFYLNGVLLDKTKTTNLNLEVDETATFTFDKITDGFEYPTQPSHFTYNNATGVLTATVAGDETFFFNEPGDAITFQHQCNLHLYVSKHATELTTPINDNDVWMVDSVTENTLYSLVKGDANVQVNVTSDNTAVIDKVNGKWKAVGAGTAHITISQAASDKWSGASITRTIKVNKYNPEFTWNLPATVNYNMAFAHPVSSTNEMEECTFSYTSNSTSVINWTNGALRTFEKAGNNIAVEVTQQGNYKWNSKSQTFYVDVAKLPNHVEINMNTQAVRDAVYSGKANKGSISCSTSGKITLNQNGGIAVWTANPLYYDIHFTGVPKNVTFTYSQSMASSTAIGETKKSFIVYESSNGSNWSEVWTSDGALGNTSTHSTTQTLNPSTQYLRFFFDGTYAGYYENIVVRERTEILSGKDKLDFGTTDAGSNASSQNVNISWYNVNPLTLSIIGGDGKYSVSPTSIESSKDSYAVGVPLTVNYAHTAAGTHNATLRISDGVTTKNIALTGTTNKVTPAITWKENLSPMSRGENVTNPAEAIVALTYTSSDSTIVDVEGNVLKPLKKGNATITASYDGSESLIYNSNSSTTNVLVTNLAVQHIHWTQTLTRLKWSDDPVLSEKNTPDFDLDATVSYYDPETEQEVEITDRAISYTSGNEAVVKVLEGNKLHVVGQGNTTLTAHINGITDSLYEATVIRDVIVREPTLDCEKWVLENKSASMATEINSYTGVETVYDLNGEPGYLSFEAWREAIHVIWDWTDGNLFVAEKIGNDWHELTGEDGLALDLNYENRKAFDSIPMSREATQVKIYKKTGSTGIHAFSGAYVTLARYLELENTKNKKTHSIDLTSTEAKPGIAVEKTFTVNYSNITDQLDVELKHGDKFSIVSGATIGNECGDKGNATVRVRFLSNEVDLYKDTLLVHNLTDTVYVYLSADVDRNHQQITWEPETLNLKTTDNVTFDAVTSASAAGLTISYAVTAGSDVASVDAATGVLTIIKDGDVTIEARCEGNNKYYDAEPVPYTFHIEKVTPTITKNPKASEVTLPATLVASTWTENGEASVEGTFAWTSPSTALVAGDVAYEVTFTPENTDWYNTATCMVAPHVKKASQTIDWSFNATEMYGNANYTFDATASSGLTVTYSSSKNDVATVNDQNKLVLHKAGESVTITATQAGDETYLPVSESRTFTVLYWEPTIMENPVGGTMYVGHVLSDASLTGGHAEVGGQEVEGSFVWENANSATIDVPGPATHNVIFVPQNGNFFAQVVCENIPLTVLRYQPHITSNTLSADGIEFPLTLEHSNLHGEVTSMDYSHVPYVEVTGHVEWKNKDAVLRPGLQTATALFVPDNSDWYDNVEIPVSIQITGGYVFNGSNTDWTEESNWAGNLVPTGIDDPVLIIENVEISTSITVGSLTIAENVDVVVKNGGVLTVGDENSETRTQYGNLHVENGGQVILGNGELKVNNFTLDAKLGNISKSAASGQVNGDEKLDVQGDAYFTLALDPDGAITYGWYDFVVPFEVDIVGGIYLPSNLNTPLTNGYDFAVMSYDEAKRAVNGKDWNKYSGTMEPGRVYTITVDYRHGWNELVFKKKKGASLTGDRSFTTSFSGLGEDVDNGWNGFGNGSLFHAELDVPSDALVQIYDHAHKCYQAHPAKDYSIAVGTSFFMQVGSVQTITLDVADDNGGRFMAPARNQKMVEKFNLSLKNYDENMVYDHLWVGANEDATEAYIIGEDVLKMGTLNEANIARMWTTKGGHNLCAVNATLNNDKANTPLSLYAPESGSYWLTIDEAPENATLFLTKNGKAIWNLSMNPCELDLEKGTTEGYGLRIVAREQTTTDIENVDSFNGEGIRKVMIDNVIYIVTPEGKMYDITGKSVKY